MRWPPVLPVTHWLFSWLTFASTLLFGLPPLIYYMIARLTGVIPSYASWEQRGGNHGPLWDDPAGAVIMFSFFILWLVLLLSVAVNIILIAFCPRDLRGKFVKQTLLLHGFQIMLFWGHLQTGWTVD